MSVYIDDMMAGFGRMKMSHLIADTTAELFALVDKIDVERRWIQKAGTGGEHFDISKAKRNAAIAAGAVPISWMELSRMVVGRRDPCEPLIRAPKGREAAAAQSNLFGDG